MTGIACLSDDDDDDEDDEEDESSECLAEPTKASFLTPFCLLSLLSS
jgi:hypothetical protein